MKPNDDRISNRCGTCTHYLIDHKNVTNNANKYRNNIDPQYTLYVIIRTFKILISKI